MPPCTVVLASWLALAAGGDAAPADAEPGVSRDDDAHSPDGGDAPDHPATPDDDHTGAATPNDDQAGGTTPDDEHADDARSPDGDGIDARAPEPTIVAPPPVVHVRRDHLEVHAEGCPGIDAPEVGRLLALDLASITGEVRRGPPLRIELACGPTQLAIAIADPITRKRLERSVPLPAAEPGRERVIALAISQLFAASWLELLMPPSTAPTLPQATDPAATVAAAERARARIDLRRRSLAVLVGATARARALERAPLGSWGGEFDVRAWFGNAGIVARAGFEGGVARRDAGSVRAWLLTLGLGAAGRVPLSRRLALGGRVVVAAALGRLRGVARTPAVATASTTAATGQATLGGGPQLRLGGALVELDVEVGGTLRPPEGLVSGDRPVSLGGVFCGGALRLGYELARPRGRGRPRGLTAHRTGLASRP